MYAEKSVIMHNDGKLRCPWPGVDPIYVNYHDTEWGVPETCDQALFEKLLLDGFQAGLSWITILRKRDAFRDVFEGFNAQKIACWTQEDIEKHMLDARIVRNRSKITSSITSARAYLEIQEKQGFARYLWNFVDGKPIQNQLKTMSDAPTHTRISEMLSKDLKKRGFNFCGPTIVYAFMQAVGMVNDHLVDCFRHQECAVIHVSL